MSSPSSTTKFFEIPPERFNGKIPFIVTNIIDALSARNAQEVEGIFRLAGNEKHMIDLIARLNDGPITDWPEEMTIHTIATLLKRYLRKMADRDSLIPTELYDTVIATMCTRDPVQKVACLKILMKRLPPIRQKILVFLCRYWRTILQFSERNKMTPSNLAVCVSQAILIAPKGLSPIEMQRQVSLGNEALACLITRSDEIFSDIEATEADFCTPEDIENLRAPKLNITNVNHFIVRNTFRRQSLIPWQPTCRVELRDEYRRPAHPPVKVEIAGEETGKLLSTARMKFVLQRAFGFGGEGSPRKDDLDFSVEEMVMKMKELESGSDFVEDQFAMRLRRYSDFTPDEETVEVIAAIGDGGSEKVDDVEKVEKVVVVEEVVVEKVIAEEVVVEEEGVEEVVVEKVIVEEVVVEEEGVEEVIVEEVVVEEVRESEKVEFEMVVEGGDSEKVDDVELVMAEAVVGEEEGHE